MPYEHKDELSKSELKRLCVLKPLEMAERIYELETQLNKKTAETFQWIDEALRLGELNAKHVGELVEAKRIIAASFTFPSAWIDANGFPHHLSHYQSVTEADWQDKPWEPLYRKPK